MSLEAFKSEVEKGYAFDGPSLLMGVGMVEGEAVPGTQISIPLGTLNRHGLIAGATGTGKTKSLQVLSEGLSANGVPVLLMDIKGDLSGLARPGESHPKIDERHASIGSDWSASGFPVELLTLSDEPGVRLRATVSEFGPTLFSKILNLSDAQSGIVAVVFKYCDDKKIPLLDLKDFKKVLQFFGEEGKDEIEADYGRIASASLGTILRKVVELEQQGAEKFFGELSFEVEDLVRKDEADQGYISILRLTDIQDKPKLFSTFMLSLLSEIYATFPEQGDADRPVLAIFIDEAHLVFDEASKALLDQIESIVRLIRSKGVGVFFVTQSPSDLPDDVLGQLGLKIQHSLRAFTAKDRKKIKEAAQNYPDSDQYDTAELLTSMGIGEAAVTALSEKGIPTPLVHTLMCAPASRMGVLTDKELKEVVAGSELVEEYAEEVDRESAYEMLGAKIEESQSEAKQEEYKKTQEKATKKKSTKKAAKEEEGSVIGDVLNSRTGQTVVRQVTRGLLGALGIKSTRRRSRSKNPFGF